MIESGPYAAFTVESTRLDDRYVIAPAGELDVSTAATLEAELAMAEASDVKRIVIDLGGLTFMDSTGLRLLLQADARSRANSNRLRLVRGSRRVQKVFELTNTEDALPFLD